MNIDWWFMLVYSLDSVNVDWFILLILSVLIDSLF